ncbi:MAG TPA: glycogen-binding domain-containing protein, partial [Gemmatimonadales bacterium]|nr:glycogen-binding domain-containing protein [Gemmatimonadales bacterium]
TAWLRGSARPSHALEAAAWQLVGRLTLSARLAGLTVRVLDTVATGHGAAAERRIRRRITDLALGARWAGGPAEATVALSLRHGDAFGDEGLAASGSLSYRLGGGLSLVASVGRQPADAARGLASTRYAMLGMRLGALAGDGGRKGAILEVSAVDDSLHLLRVEAPEARRVQLMADFTAWRPAELHPCGEGAWEILLPLAPGTYRVAIRLDEGPWTAPAGLPSVESEFGGRVGVLVVP